MRGLYWPAMLEYEEIWQWVKSENSENGIPYIFPWFKFNKNAHVNLPNILIIKELIVFIFTLPFYVFQMEMGALIPFLILSFKE